MTRDEKIKLLEAYCEGIPFDKCMNRQCEAYIRESDLSSDCKCLDDCTDAEIDAALRAIGKHPLDEKVQPQPEPEKPDALDHPGHYNREGAMECIEEMLLLFGREETMSFCKLNAWKYRYRAADKGGMDDLKKSDRYLAKYKELKERTE